VLVTAINLDLGGKIWWPSKLDRDPVIEPTSTTSEAEPAPAQV
jgi:RND superfamily putative drug exporter